MKWAIRVALALSLWTGLFPAMFPVSAQARATAGDGIAIPDAIRERLAVVTDYRIEVFYKRRLYEPFWIRDGAVVPEACQLVAILRRSGLDGLDGGDRLAAGVKEALDKSRSGTPADLAAAELALSSAWVDYVQALRQPVDVGMTFADPSLMTATPFPVAILSDAASAPSLAHHLEAVSALNPIYSRLRDGLAGWIERWGRLPRLKLPHGAPLSLGSSGPRVALLRMRLALPDGDSFDRSTAAVVSAFKLAHGLDRTPLVDNATIAMLNQDLGEIEHRLRVNLDRARVLPENGRFIVVDAASARLWAYDDGQLIETMKVVVGKTSAPTPMLAGLIKTIVLNPYWNIPPDLVKERVAPNVLSLGRGYLSSKGYQVLSDWSDHAHLIDPRDVDWAGAAAGRAELRIRQLPGPSNAMGKMKFMFPNDFGVYLHDTPDKQLFAKDARMFSAGCVRLEQAERLAKWLFGENLHTTGDVEQPVPLPKPVPVFLTYLTARWDGTNFGLRADVYGRDAIHKSGSTKITSAPAEINISLISLPDGRK